MQYLDRLIEENRTKGRKVPDVVDDEYWRRRRENELLKDQPLKKAA
jgi:hypothetical protein